MTKYTAEEAKKVWLISDTHFDHANIIRYCDRPFRSAHEMNQTLLQNWNDTVAPDDIVYFLGDMSFGRQSREAEYWLDRLNGKKIFIRGSHDRRRGIEGDSLLKVADRQIIQVEDTPFMLIHDALCPAVDGWDGWIIHGHNHHRRPFVNYEDRRVNVSVEAIGYKPISLYEILQRIKDAQISTVSS
jgi:calcineurin-like phosphoesterase family protein